MIDSTKSIRRQRGFTLLEVMVAMLLVGALYAIASESFGPALAFRAEVETKERQKDLRQAVHSAYKLNAINVDASSTAELDFGGTYGKLEPVEPDPATKRCAANATTFASVASFSSMSAGDAFRDGYGNPVCVLITPRLSLTVSGSTVYYHSVAIVSPGKNGVIEAGTTLSATTGNMSVDGDDIGILLDGRNFAQERYDLTLESIRRAADAYQAYFSVRYQSDPARSISVDYFSCGDDAACPPATANALWDAGNGMPSTCAGAVPMFASAGISPHAVLGLSQSDVTDGYGNIITMDNCGSSVRSPGNVTVALRAPPYTAVISTTLPGGGTLSQTAVGQF